MDKEPLITVTASYIKEIEWLAGRGYNTLGISFPAVFQGEKDYASGNFLTVLWENLTDPILTGREELGFSKIFCDLPEPKIHNGEILLLENLRFSNDEELNSVSFPNKRSKNQDIYIN